MSLDIITHKGRRCVPVPIEEYERLNDQAPPFPPVDADGTSNAIDFARAAIARRLIADRRSAGLSQQRLGKLAGVRQETISRIESGKQTATVRVIDKLDKAIRRASGQARKRKAG
ncbi:MAG: helix-turn-helix transcriptional regulator [Tepidisphaeraceae bacterium]